MDGPRSSSSRPPAALSRIHLTRAATMLRRSSRRYPNMEKKESACAPWLFAGNDNGRHPSILSSSPPQSSPSRCFGPKDKTRTKPA